MDLISIRQRQATRYIKEIYEVHNLVQISKHEFIALICFKTKQSYSDMYHIKTKISVFSKPKCHFWAYLLQIPFCFYSGRLLLKTICVVYVEAEKKKGSVWEIAGFLEMIKGSNLNNMRYQRANASHIYLVE